LTSTTFDNANIRGANFESVADSGFLKEQLYSTASYKNHDLRFSASPGFTKEQLYSTASYKSGDLTGVNFGSSNVSNWNFSGQNLTNAVFFGTATGANFTNAEIKGAALTPTGFTKEQLYSTASYKNHVLAGIEMSYSDCSGWNFADQDITNARFQRIVLANANLSNANLTNGVFIYGTLDKRELQQCEFDQRRSA
jgi:uncharacterized protein YjbI with pentapeptide repeats